MNDRVAALKRFRMRGRITLSASPFQRVLRPSIGSISCRILPARRCGCKRLFRWKRPIFSRTSSLPLPVHDLRCPASIQMQRWRRCASTTIFMSWET